MACFKGKFYVGLATLWHEPIAAEGIGIARKVMYDCKTSYRNPVLSTTPADFAKTDELSWKFIFKDGEYYSA